MLQGLLGDWERDRVGTRTASESFHGHQQERSVSFIVTDAVRQRQRAPVSSGSGGSRKVGAPRGVRAGLLQNPCLLPAVIPQPLWSSLHVLGPVLALGM